MKVFLMHFFSLSMLTHFCVLFLRKPGIQIAPQMCCVIRTPKELFKHLLPVAQPLPTAVVSVVTFVFGRADRK
jgi:hypothetical protein